MTATPAERTETDAPGGSRLRGGGRRGVGSQHWGRWVGSKHWGRWGRWAVPVTAGVGLIHALVVSIRYHVGSFDDDSSYISAARAVAAGHGLTSGRAGGYPLIGVYPPGYPALLSPLTLIWRTRVGDFRALSLLLFLAVFPLMWIYLGRRGTVEPVRVAVLGLVAMNPVLGTYATMVMAEVPFVVLLLLLFLAADCWEHDPRLVCRSGVATVACAAGLVWTKEAAIGLVAGLAIWLAWRRCKAKAATVALGTIALVAPLLVVRLLAGANLIGSRYSKDLGGSFRPGDRNLLFIVPDALWQYARAAIPQSIVPTRHGVFEHLGPFSAALLVVSWLSAPLVVVGFVVWWRRHQDAACLVVPAYLAETLVYPYTNERRVVLVLPVVIAWYVLGAVAATTGFQAFIRRGLGPPGGRAVRLASTGLPLLVALLAVTELVGQFPRDYLYDLWGDSSHPGRSAYMTFLQHLGPADQVVETDYLWTTALFTGHRTADAAYLVPCQPDQVSAALRADDAGFLLTSGLNGGGDVDDSCIVPVVAGLPGAVRLFRGGRDIPSVFELIGPGTPNAGLHDAATNAAVTASGEVLQAPEPQQVPGEASGSFPEVVSSGGSGTLSWTWPSPASVTQLSFGTAGALGAITTFVEVADQLPDGSWHPLAHVEGAVRPGGSSQYFLTDLPADSMILGFRVTVGVGTPVDTAAGTSAASGANAASGTAPLVAVHDFHALGP